MHWLGVTPAIPVTVDTLQMQGPKASPKVTTVLHFAARTPPILVTVDTFETQGPEASPKAMTVLRFPPRSLCLLTLSRRQDHKQIQKRSNMFVFFLRIFLVLCVFWLGRDPRDPCDCRHFTDASPEASPKATTVLRFATRTPPDPCDCRHFSDARTRGKSKSDSQDPQSL